jgi:hypothetical protein
VIRIPQKTSENRTRHATISSAFAGTRRRKNAGRNPQIP